VQVQNLFSRSTPVDPKACSHMPVPVIHCELCAVPCSGERVVRYLVRMSFLSCSCSGEKKM
jgi:hypothetical protein